MSTAASREAQPGSPPACIWCGQAFDSDAIALGERLGCPACGTATTDPWPTDDVLEEAYASWYRPDSGRFSGLGDAILRRTRGRLAKRLDRRAGPGRVLDVGAGDGSLLDALHSRGRDATGLERESTRPDVIDADLTEIEGPWSAIVLWHSLEHLPQPGAAIDAAVELLSPGGLLVVAIPNAESLQARVFGDRWFALDIPRHLSHIPASALIARLEARGMAIERTSFARGGQVVFGWLHGLVGSLPGRPNFYDAIRRPEARGSAMSPGKRIGALLAGVVLLPVAAIAAVVEIAARRGGTVYVEARRS